jgi:hypothetical protein
MPERAHLNSPNAPASQAHVLDALEFSFDTVHRAYRRLQTTLLREAHRRGPDTDADKVRLHTRQVDAMIDAWAMVDALNRSRRLIESSSWLTKKSAATKLIIRELEQAKDLRDEVQHLHEKIAEIVDNLLPAFGYLSWVGVIDEPDSRTLTTSVLVPGLLLDGMTLDVVNPVGKEITERSDLITLFAAGRALNLSHKFRQFSTYIDRLESAIANTGDDEGAADQPIILHVTTWPVAALCWIACTGCF